MNKQAQHTPDHIHNPSSCCSCKIEFNDKAATIVYCARHRAAPELLAACSKALKAIDDAASVRNRMSSGEGRAIDSLKAAIAAAEGRDAD